MLGFTIEEHACKDDCGEKRAAPPALQQRTLPSSEQFI